MTDDVNSPNKWEADYERGSDGWDFKGPTPAFKRLADSGRFPPGRMIVLGAGRGHDAREFARHGFQVTAVDFSPHAVREMRRLAAPDAPVEILQSDLFMLPPEFDHAFDYLLEYTCFCAIHPQRREEYADLVARLLRSPGVLQGRNPDVLQGRSPGVVQGRSPGVLQGRSPGVLQGRSPDVLQGRSPDVLQGRSPDVLQGRSPGVVQGRSPGVLQGRSPGVVQGRSPGVLQGRSPGVVQGRSPGVVQGRSPEVTSGKPGGIYIDLAFPLDGRKGGPPFAVSLPEILTLFGKRGFTLLERQTPIDSVQQRRGLEELLIFASSPF